MTTKTIKAINKFCDRYGNKLNELMELCGVYKLPDVPEDKAVEFLEKLKRENEV